MRVAVVTGMARTAGIGHAVCTSLLDSGLAVIGIDHIPLESSSPLLGRPQFLSKVASVTDSKALITEISAGLSELNQSHISVVVNNAGIAQPFLESKPLPPYNNNNNNNNDDDNNNNNNSNSNNEIMMELLSHRLDEFDKYIQVNLRSAFLVTEVCRPYFPSKKEQNKESSGGGVGGGNFGGCDCDVSIIHISSTRALQSPERSEECPYGQHGYAAAKAGMIGLMHSQGQELAGIARVNTILPGWIHTDDPKYYNNNNNDDGDNNSEEGCYYEPTKKDHDWHASGRVGRPTDVAELVTFLADKEKSGFITCQEFIIDGGVTRKMVYPE